MTPYNRRHKVNPGHNLSSLQLAGELQSKHPNTILMLLTALLDLHPQLVGCDLADTAERVSRYGPRSMAREATDRLVSSQNEEDKHILHHYLNQTV